MGDQSGNGAAQMTGDALIDALIIVVLLAFVLERALAVVFEIRRIEQVTSDYDIKPLIAAIVSIAICAGINLNLLQAIAESCDGCNDVTFATSWGWFVGVAVTGLVAAGGSAGAVKLFQDVLGFRRSSRDASKELKAIADKADQAEAEARMARAEANKKLAEAPLANLDGSGRYQLGQLGLSVIEEAITDREIEEGYRKALRELVPVAGSGSPGR